MPALSRAVCLGLQAAALVALVGPSLAPSPALASPIPLPMPMVAHIADYAARPPIRANATAMSVERRAKDVVVVAHTTSKSHIGARDGDVDTNFLNNINILNLWSGKMNQQADIIHGLASQASTEGANSDYHQRVVTAVTAYHDTLSNYQTILVQLGSDKGLANYDRDDALETLLKDMVNLTKYTLKDIDTIIYQIPVLGPILGPIVYEIKCILDEVLDALENLTDAILNAIKPLILALIGQATASACNMGIDLGVLCLVI
ncbi:hypothetical protein C8Q79DRAFT_1005104 [Trametes meyenii]|nr:hypothetical protein C8Q79DRAFT_1005104 [Trametes meyenii]